MNAREYAMALESRPTMTRRVAPAYSLGRIEVASISDRAGAYLLDGIFLAIGSVALLMLGLVESWLMIWAGAHLYFLVSELAFRKSLGKRILGLEVVNNERERASAGQVFIRAILRPVDDLLWSAVGLISMFASDDNQRLGDRAAGTVVVKKI